MRTSTHMRSAFGPEVGGGSSTNTSFTMSPVRSALRSATVGIGKVSGKRLVLRLGVEKAPLRGHDSSGGVRGWLIRDGMLV